MSKLIIFQFVAIIVLVVVGQAGRAQTPAAQPEAVPLGQLNVAYLKLIENDGNCLALATKGDINVDFNGNYLYARSQYEVKFHASDNQYPEVGNTIIMQSPYSGFFAINIDTDKAPSASQHTRHVYSQDCDANPGLCASIFGDMLATLDQAKARPIVSLSPDQGNSIECMQTILKTLKVSVEKRAVSPQ